MGQIEALARFAGLGARAAIAAGTWAAGQMAPYLFRFILFDGAGMRLLLGDAHRGQSIQNGFALYL